MVGLAGVEPAMWESKSHALPFGDSPINGKERTLQAKSALLLWGAQRESNPRPPEPQSGALTNCAMGTTSGAPEGTRTPGPLLRRQLLYPAELRVHKNGASDGNRTHATRLEGLNSNIELHSHMLSFCLNIIAHQTTFVNSFFIFFEKIFKCSKVPVKIHFLATFYPQHSDKKELLSSLTTALLGIYIKGAALYKSFNQDSIGANLRKSLFKKLHINIKYITAWIS